MFLVALFNQHEVDGKAYYSFEFIAQAPNFTRHALGTICIGNGMKTILSFSFCQSLISRTLRSHLTDACASIAYCSLLVFYLLFC